MTASESVCDMDDFRRETYGSPVAMRSSDTASLKRERARFMTTIDSLTDDEFEIGTTLCEGWAPRDVLAHIIGTQDMLSYFRPSGLTIARANAKMVADGRALGRAQLSELGWRAATEPGLSARLCAHNLLIGDAIVHQDVMRGLGKPYGLPQRPARRSVAKVSCVAARSCRAIG
jgi:mycothiol maleylpyruvate isomerase-like protein